MLFPSQLILLSLSKNLLLQKFIILEVCIYGNRAENMSFASGFLFKLHLNRRFLSRNSKQFLSSSELQQVSNMFETKLRCNRGDKIAGGLHARLWSCNSERDKNSVELRDKNRLCKRGLRLLMPLVLRTSTTRPSAKLNSIKSTVATKSGLSNTPVRATSIKPLTAKMAPIEKKGLIIANYLKLKHKTAH